MCRDFGFYFGATRDADSGLPKLNFRYGCLVVLGVLCLLKANVSGASLVSQSGLHT